MNYFNSNEKAVTAIGILLTLLLSAITLVFTVRNNKAIHYIDTVTKSRVEWINKLRKLSSQYISLTGINNFTATASLENDEIYKKIFQTSMEIRLMLNMNDKFDKKVIHQIELINSKYLSLLNSYNCINECRDEFINNGFSKELAINPTFINFLIDYAKLENYTTKPFIEYIKDYSSVEELFFQFNSSEEKIKKFINKFINYPEELMSEIDLEIEEYIRLIQIYLKAEWDRVKMEANNKSFLSKNKIKKEIETLLEIE